MCETDQSALKENENGKPLVTILMPAYNREKYIREALSSIFEDTYSPKEVIVVDDGSTDGTAAITRDFPAVHYIYQEHQGVSVARNHALGVATGEYVTFLDSDDIWIPGRLAMTIGLFEQDPQVDYLLCMQETFLEKGAVKPPGLLQSRLDFPHESIGTSVLTAKRSCFTRIGNFNPTFSRGEDLDWLARAAKAGLIMKRIPETLVRVRIHDQNLTFAGKTEHREIMLKIIRNSVLHKKDEQNPENRG